MAEFKQRATVNDKGQLVPEAPAVWNASIRELVGKRVVVTVETEKKVRSTQANRYYWSCVVPIFQEVWSIARSKLGLEPLTKEESHEVLVQVLVGCEDGPLPGSRIRRRTSEMDSKEFAAYVEKCRALAQEQYGMWIPAAGEEYEPVSAE